jgi:hypothetical protein
MKKRKPPKLVVDNELPDDDEDGWKVICEQVRDVHNRYPEIDVLLTRARETDDRAMWMAVVAMCMSSSTSAKKMSRRCFVPSSVMAAASGWTTRSITKTQALAVTGFRSCLNASIALAGQS